MVPNSTKLKIMWGGGIDWIAINQGMGFILVMSQTAETELKQFIKLQECQEKQIALITHFCLSVIFYT